MRILFVGIHNKPYLKPLCSSTKTGKLVNRIIENLPKGIEVVKTNLCNVDTFPNQEDIVAHNDEWYWTYLPNYDDIIVLLGAFVHDNFRFDSDNIIKIAHPASKRSHNDMEEYVIRSVDKIKSNIKRLTIKT